MDLKLIFLDIDGTLTEPGANVPPASALEAIRGAQANGHRVVLCSGRNYGMLSPLLQYGFDGLVGSAGGYIEYGGEVVYDCPMTPEQQDRVLSVFEESGIYRTVESKDGSYTDEGFKDFLRESAGSGGNSELLRWREQLEQDLGIRPMAEYRGGTPLQTGVHVPGGRAAPAAPTAAGGRVRLLPPGRRPVRHPQRGAYQPEVRQGRRRAPAGRLPPHPPAGHGGLRRQHERPPDD